MRSLQKNTCTLLKSRASLGRLASAATMEPPGMQMEKAPFALMAALPVLTTSSHTAFPIPASSFRTFTTLPSESVKFSGSGGPAPIVSRIAPTISRHCWFMEKASVFFKHAGPLLAFQFSSRDLVMVPHRASENAALSSFSGTNSPTLSSTNIKGPPDFAPITGVPQAMHSMKTIPNGSFHEGKTPMLATLASLQRSGCICAPKKKVRFNFNVSNAMSW
mmetsp:Transcript_105363/g.235118  ORF Transcript_105363/g.235118 Transcript_105363/m.235118 type:complete len:219 (+) Transcript_105363:1725-2381(+)